MKRINIILISFCFSMVSLFPSDVNNLTNIVYYSDTDEFPKIFDWSVYPNFQINYVQFKQNMYDKIPYLYIYDPNTGTDEYLRSYTDLNKNYNMSFRLENDYNTYSPDSVDNYQEILGEEIGSTKENYIGYIHNIEVINSNSIIVYMKRNKGSNTTDKEFAVTDKNQISSIYLSLANNWKIQINYRYRQSNIRYLQLKKGVSPAGHYFFDFYWIDNNNDNKSKLYLLSNKRLKYSSAYYYYYYSNYSDYYCYRLENVFFTFNNSNGNSNYNNVTIDNIINMNDPYENQILGYHIAWVYKETGDDVLSIITPIE